MPGDFHTIQAVIKLQAQLQAPEGAGQNHRQRMIEVPAERHAFKTIREGCPFQASVEIPSKGQSLQTSDATPTSEMNLTYMCMLSRALARHQHVQHISNLLIYMCTHILYIYIYITCS